MSVANRKVGAYELENITIINYRGKTVDIKSSVIGFNIQAEIFNTTLHGELVIKDSNDFIQNLPLIGEEFLKIEFKKNGINERTTLLFYIYSLVDKIKRSDNSFEYVLNFCSLELLTNRGESISESFINIEVSDMVNKILSRITKKKIYVEETSTKMNYIAPNISPFEIINYMTSRTISKKFSNSGSFVFYEDFNGFNFKTIDSMLISTPVATYTFEHKTFITTDINNELYTISKWKVDQHYDILDNLNKGGYGINTKVLNPFTRKYTSKTFNVLTEEDYKNINNLDNNYKNALHDNNTFLFTNAPNNINKFRMSYNDYNKEHIIGQRYVQLNLISNGYKLIAQIPGNLEINIGNVINLEHKNHSVDKRETDLYLSGKYLITAIKYEFSNTEFQMFIEIIKDSYDNNHNEFNRIPLIGT